MRNKILAIILTMLMTMQITFAAPFNGNAKTKRIPAGTKLELKMLNSIDTSVDSEGGSFSAMLITDQTAEDDVILPAGSIIRGDVKGIALPQRLSKGAVLYLNFDHVVTPNGRQLPLSLNITGRADMTYDGGITTTKGYYDAWKQTCAKSKSITKDSIKWGEGVTETGWKYVVVPIAAFGGVVGTAGYFVYGSVADMIKKGKHVQINKDEVLNVILVDPIDVPVI
ncbi:MAG: hypothetical protein NC191_07690 [Muribaculaceae bacterium]|nr:hypothetical protein [Muribaculaceae bacterium]